MKIDGIQIEVNSVYEHALREELFSRVSFLFSVPRGTIPMNRTLGLPSPIMDMNAFETRGEFTVAAIELVEEYEPRVTVDSVDFVEVDGKISPKVVLRYNGD